MSSLLKSFLKVLVVAYCSFLGLSVASTCSSEFSLLEENLLSNQENRFQLSKTFFPQRVVQPVFVTVEYTYTNSSSNSTVTWYWSEAEFYLIQPLEILQFSSLFFSNPPRRQGFLTLQLDGECQNASEEHMQILTERLGLYAETSTISVDSSPARITRSYVAVSASREEIVSGRFTTHFSEIWLHIIVFLTPIVLAILVYMCDPIQSLFGNKTWQKLEDESSHPSIAAFVQLSIVFTIYVFIVDMMGCVYTAKSDLLSYERNSLFYVTGVSTLLIDGFALILVAAVIMISCAEEYKGFITKTVGPKLRPGYAQEVYRIILVTLIAPVLCFSNHLHFITISFASDPFHAGSIWIAYLISGFFYFFMFRRFYALLAPFILKKEEELKRKNLSENETNASEWKKDYYRVRFSVHTVMIGLITLAPIMVLFEAAIVVFYTSLPIDKTWADSPSTLYSIYQGTGILIVMLLTYNILLNPSPFSLVKAVNKIGKELNIVEKLPNWDKFNNEEKFANIVLTLYSKVHAKEMEVLGTQEADAKDIEAQETQIDMNPQATSSENTSQ